MTPDEPVEPVEPGSPDSPGEAMSAADRLLLTAAALRVRAANAVAGFRTLPEPGTGEVWDVGQLLAHCAEFLPYWLAQAQLVIDAGGGEVPFGRVKTDPQRIVAIEQDRGTEPETLLARMDLAVEQVVDWLETRTDEQLALTGTHPTLGVLTVAGIIERFCLDHLEEHVEQLG
ncbi:MAG TPA: DinB family protein [Mycobacteriales bacterium]|nr:DinB family protein [Mycobacteriales bacterium]